MNKNYITLGTSGSATLNDKGNSNISTMFSSLAAWQKKAFMALLFAMFSIFGASAQVTTNSGSGLAATYPTLSAAITALNAATITSPVTITLDASNPQTAPSGGYSITATGTETNTITINGGSNTITAPSQTAGVLTDAIFKIIGGDYITIQGFTMRERVFTPVAGDTTATTNTMTEFGVALFYTSVTNGAQNCTIQNNTISLNRTYQNTFGIYSNSSHSSTNITANASATSTAGSNSGLKVYGNTISNINIGLVVVGANTAANFNTGIDIGGTASGTGNTISNFGTTGVFSGYNLVSGTVNGVFIRNCTGFNVSYNSITSSNGGITASATLRGVFIQSASAAPTGTFTNNINNNTIALTHGFTSGTIQGITVESSTGTATSTQNINNNNFTTLRSSALATSGAITAISNVMPNLVNNFNGNTFTNISSNTTGSFTFFGHSYTMPATGSQTFDSNAIVTAFGKTGTGGTVSITSTNGSSPAGTAATYTNNNFSNITVTGATTLTGFNNTDGGTGSAKTITGNTFNNWTGGTSNINSMNFTYFSGTSTLSSNTVTNITGQSSVTGITVGSAAIGTLLTIASNTINNLSSTGTGGQVVGLSCSNTSTTININNNAINTLSSTGASSAVGGILVSAAATTNVFSNTIFGIASSGAGSPLVLGISVQGGTNVNTYQNKIYGLSASGAISTASPAVMGINITAGTNVNTYNNLIGTLTAPAANLTDAIRGINIASTAATSTQKVYYNTININASSTGTNFGSTGIFHTYSATATTSSLDMRNNIIVNASVANGTGRSVAFRRSAATDLVNYATTSNNNLFFGTSGVYTDGTNTYATLAAYKLAMVTRDQASVSENPTFQSTTGSSADFLKYSTSIATQIESAASTVAEVTTDFIGTARNASTPDIGAWELVGVAADLTGPSIGYTNIPNSLCTTAPTLSATITDASSVDVTAGTAPRIYFKKSTDANTYAGNTSADNGWKFVESTSGASPFSFTLNGSLLQAPLAAGDVIQYFVVAQDLVTVPNIGIKSGIFAAAPSSVALTADAFALTGTINSYTIGTPVATAVTIGAAGNYPTLTGAGGLFAAINTGGLSGNTVATIIDESITETAANALNQITYGCTANVTLTIKPQTIATLTGSVASGALIKLNGADYVTFDGSNSEGTDKSLTIINTSTTAPRGIWIASTGLAAGATNNTIKNCIINVNSSLSASASGISVSNGTTINTAGADNDDVTIQNNTINSPLIGVYAVGLSTGRLDNLKVIGNTFATGSSTASGVIGVQVGQALNALVTSNTLNLTSSAGSNVTGISLETGVASTAVTANKLQTIASTNTIFYGGRGITVGTGSAASDITIANNAISGVNGLNYTSFGYTSSGIFIGTIGNSTTITTVAGGVKIYNNSVNMAGSYGYAGACVTAGLYLGTGASALDIRNNIFVNSLNNTNASGTGSKNYAIYSAVANTAFTEINYNDYFVSGTQGVLGFLTSDRATLTALSTATGKDVNSVVGDPKFTSNSDLHILTDVASIAESRGVAIAGFDTDIDNNPRFGNSSYTGTGTNPDLGADEFEGITANPTITDVSALAVCPYTSFTITGTNFTAGITAVAVGGTAVNSFTVDSATQITAVVGIGTSGVVSVTFGGTIYYGTQTITIPTLPATPTVTAAVPKFCGVGGVTALSVAPYNDALTYTWSALTPTATLNAITGQSVDATITETSDFSLVVSTNGCSLLPIFYSVSVYSLPTAQVTTSASGVCPNTEATINSGLVAEGFTASCINAPGALSTPPASAVLLCSNGALNANSGYANTSGLDDGYWNTIPIGFNFNYFAQPFTSVNIGTNGTVNFAASGTTQYSFPGGFPNASNPASTIAVCARDLQLSATGGNGSYGNGEIRFWTEGYSPNRKFIVQYANCTSWYSTNANDGVNSAELVLYETTGVVEIRVIKSTNPTATTGSFINDTRNKFIGLQDPTKTIGATANNCGVTAQTPNYWNGVSNEIINPQAWRFDPADSYLTTWYNTPSGGSKETLTTGSNIFAQIVSPEVTTVYEIVYTNQTTGCTNAAGSAQVTMQILGEVAPSGVVAVSNFNPICGAVPINLSLDFSNAVNYGGNLDGLTFQWQSSIDGGTTWIDVDAATSATLTTTPAQPTSYKCVIKSCGGTAIDTAPVNITYTNTLTGVTQPEAACGVVPTDIVLSGLIPNTTFIVSYNINGGATRTAEVTSDASGAGTFDTSIGSAVAPIVLTITKLDAGTCAQTITANNTVTLVVSSATVATSPTLSNPSVSVLPNSTVVLSATPSVGTYTLRWYNAPSKGTLLATGNDYTTPLLCTPGAAISYYVEEFNGTCPGSRAVAVVNVQPLIVSDPANGLICSEGGSVQLSANVANTSNFVWSGSPLSSTTAAVVTAEPTTTTQYGLSVGTSGVCGTITSTFNVGVIQGANFTPSTSLTTACADQNVQLNANLSSSNFSVGSIPFVDVTVPSTGVTYLVTNGITAAPSGVALTGGTLDDGGWNGIPIGFTYNFFGADYTKLAVGTNGVLGLGNWTDFSTTTGLGKYAYSVDANGKVFPLASNPKNVIALMASDLIQSVSGSASGSIRYWTEGIAPTRKFVIQYLDVRQYNNTNTYTFHCVLSETTGTVEIYIKNAPAGTGNNAPTIGLQNFDATIGATAPGRTKFTGAITTPEGWNFSPAANYSFEWKSSNNLSDAYIVNPVFAAGSSAGSYTYTVDATNPNTGCVTTKAAPSFTVVALPAAPAATTAYSYCQNATAAALTAAATGTNTLMWYTVATGGTGTATAPTPSTATVGTFSRWVAQISAEGCIGDRTEIVITINALPSTPSVTSQVSYCQNAIAVPLAVTSSTVGNGLNWYYASTGGNAETAITPSTATAGASNYYVSEEDAAGCESIRASITVNVNTPPAAPSVVGSNVTYCQNETASALTAIETGAGYVLNWYTAATGGSSTSSITPSTTAVGTTNYFVSQSNTNFATNCEGPRAMVTVTVNSLPTVFISAPSTTTCNNTDPITFTATPSNAGTPSNYEWHVNDGTDTIVQTSASNQFVYSTPATGDNVYVVMTSVTSCSNNAITSNTVTLSGDPVTPSIAINAVPPTNICPGGSVTFTSSIANGGASPTYNWYVDGVAQNVNSATFTYTPATGASVYATLQSGLGASCLTSTSAVSSNTVGITYKTATSIVSTPSSLLQCAGTTAQFSVGALGTNLTYQWLLNGNPITGNATATASTLIVNSITSSNAGNYTVTVTGECGVLTTTTAAVLSVYDATSFVTQPVGQTVCATSNVTFTAGATGGNGSYTYIWKKNGVTINGQASSSLVLNNVSVASAGSYTVTVTGNCNNVVSAPAVLTVNAANSIISPPVGSTQCPGSTINLSVSASGSGTLSYKWKFGTTSTNGTYITGATASSYSVASVTVANQGYYSVEVSSSTNCGTVTSTPVLVNILNTTVITNQPAPRTVCEAGTATFTVTATGTNLSYQWRKGTSAIAGATAAAFTLNPVSVNDGGSYSAVVSGSCGTLTSNAAALSVNAKPVVDNNTVNSCTGTPFNGTPPSAPANTTYTWTTPTYSSPSVTGGSSQTSGIATISQTLTNSSTATETATYTVTPTAASCAGNPFTLTVTADAIPSLSSTITPAAICSGATFSYTATSLTTTATFAWTRAVVTGITAIAGSGNSAVVSEVLTNTTAAPIDVAYVFTLTNGGCTTTATVTVKVNPTPILSSALTASTCSNSALAYTATSATTGTTFSWSRGAVAGISNGGSSNTTNPLTETLINTSTATVPVTYGYTLTANGCSSAVQNVVVSVYPLPLLSNAVKTATLCSGNLLTYTGTTATGGTTFSWSRAAVTGISNAAGSGTAALISETLINTTTLPINVVYAYTLTANGCSKSAQNVTVTVNPSPAIAAKTVAMCVSGSFSVAPVHGTDVVPAGTTYTWSAPVVTGGVTGGAAGTSASSITGTLANPSTASQTATYTVTPTSGAAGSCPGTPFTITVTLSPVSVGGSVAGSTTVCTGTNSTTLTLSGHTGAITRWERSLDNFATAGTTINNTTTSLIASNLTVTSYYRAVITSGTCTAANSAVATLTVIPTSVGGTVAGSATVCTGTNSTTLTLSGHTGDITRWESSASSTFASGVSSIANTSDTLTATDLTATTYYRAVLTSSPCSSANSAIATVTVSPASVGGTVAGSTNVCTGTSSTTLTLSGHTGAVTGWESSLDNFATAGTSIANTTTSLVVTNITETTYYRAIITSSPCSAENSAIATLTVIPTSVGGSVAGSATVCTGTNSTALTLSGYTGTITRWESSTSSTFASEVTSIANTSDTFTATDLTATTYYRAVVTSSPCSSANSEIATVTVSPASVGGTVAGSTTVCTGTNTATLTVSGYTGAITNWESSVDNFATAGTSIANTTDTLTATDLTETTYYRAVVTNSPCSSANSATATVTVSPTSVGGTVAGSATVCAVTDSATLTLSSHTGAVTRWESSISSDFSSVVTSINNTTTTLIVSGLPETTYYRAVVTSGACAAANSDTATVTVNPTPVIPAQTASICTGGTFTITPTNGVPTAATIVPSGTMYTWTVAENANVTGDVAEETPQTGISQTLTNNTSEPQQVVYTVTPQSGAVGSCVGATFTITVTVNPYLTPTFTPVASICAGASLSALPTTSNNGYTGTWAPALDNTQTTEYTFTPTAGECANSTTLTITVVPYVTPSFTAVDPICSGATLAALPTTSNNGITGTWAPDLDNTETTEYTFTPAVGQCGTVTTLTITVNPNITPTFTAVAAICSGETLSALPTTSNNGYTGAWSPELDNTATTEYTFTPTAGQCATTTTLTITVNPILTASVSIAITDGTQTSCVGTSVTFTATPTNGGTPSYQWKVNGNDAGTDSATFTSSTLANGDAVTVVMTSNASPCLANATATSNAINVTVNPTITASVSIASSCGASSATFTATPVNGGSDPVYQWKINGNNVGTNSATFTTSTLADNDQVTVVMASSASPCLTNPSVTSNTITVTLNPELAPSVSIAITAGTQASCVGTSVTFTATPTNGGEPSYQWKVNGTNAGTNSATFTSSTLADNDVVKVEMTSTAASCWLDPTVTSNTITVDVNPLNTITLTSASTSNNQSLCNPANFASITYATTAATGADFSGLPAGLTGSWSSDTVTISGTPTVNGTFNYTVTLTGGCGTVTATGTIGTYSTTWTVTSSGEGSWSNGAPTASVGAVISGNYAENVDLNACTLTVNNNAVVSVVAGKDFHIAGAVTVETGSSLTVEHNANLLQDGTANANSGEITAKRINSSMRRLDYTYWSSPTAKSDYSLKMFSPMTISPISLPAGGVTGASRFYYINETTNAFVAVEPTTTYFDDANIARGWSIRAPNNFPTNGTTATFNANWIGKPNSGNITIPVTYSGAGKGSNLIGNPYPSTIDTDAFLTYSPDNVTFPNAGTIYFWSHSVQNAQGTANYASCNLSGKTAAAAGGSTPNGKIQVGQGFILKKAAASTVVFNNAMRAGNNEGQFFKTATIERNRIWLNLAVDTTPLNQIMVGYIEGTTLGFDDAYDGKLINNASSISSIIDNENYVIQARPTPFVNTDEVPLNFNATTAGSYTLSLDHVDGLFLGEQNVYLKDNLLNVTHDIKASAYTFTSDQGTFNNRFEVVYINSTLNISTPTFDANSVIVYKDDNKVLNINAGKVVMKNVKIYDVRGRLVYEKSNINTTTTALKDLKAEQEVLLVKITSDDNKVVTKKVVF